MRSGLIGHPEREELARVIAAADRHDDMLFAVQHVRDRRSRLRRRHVHRTEFVPVRLVVRPQHRARRTTRRRGDLRIAGPKL